jgi:hypothetical protein
LRAAAVFGPLALRWAEPPPKNAAASSHIRNKMTRSFRSSRAAAGAGVFALMNEAGAAARAAGLAVVDLSVGTPDLPPPPEAIDALRVRLVCVYTF